MHYAILNTEENELQFITLMIVKQNYDHHNSKIFELSAPRDSDQEAFKLAL